MGKSQETWNKKERERKKEKIRKEKNERKLERKENAQKGKSLDDMMAYIDENGHISSTPPDPTKRRAPVKLEDIEIGVPKHVETDPDAMRVGTITFFNEEKGYGFIKDLETQEDFFVHVNDLAEPVKRNNKVNFQVAMGNRGPNAVNVKLAG